MMSDPNEDALDRADQSVENIEDDRVELPAPEPEKLLNFGE